MSNIENLKVNVKLHAKRKNKAWFVIHVLTGEVIEEYEQRYSMMIELQLDTHEGKVNWAYHTTHHGLPFEYEEACKKYGIDFNEYIPYAEAEAKKRGYYK